MHFSPKARSYQAVVALVALFLMSGTALAAATSFGSITVGKNDKNSQIQLQGPILNPGKYPDGKGRPVNITDNLIVQGDVMVMANKSLKAEGSNSLNVGSPLYVAKKLELGSDLVFTGGGWIRSPNAAIGVDDDLTVTGSFGVTKNAVFSGGLSVAGTFGAATGGFTGNAVVGGDLGVSGSIKQGSVNMTNRINETRIAANAIIDFMSCVQALSQYSGYVESADFTDCWNIWIAGHVADPIP